MNSSSKQPLKGSRIAYKTMPCYISRLPDHILKIIFCKLPVTFLPRCRYVCKLWEQILLDPDFANCNLSIREPTNLFLCMKDKSFYWLEFQGESLHFNLSAELNCLPGSLIFVNSCNGLLCACQDYKVMHIINPITCEYISYPPCEDGVRLHANLSGLGFDPKTEKFKVLRFTYPLGMAMGAFSVEHLKAEVCTLGNTTWRSIAQHQQFVRSHFHSDNFNVFMNGSLHRIADHEGVRQICAFDCESEQFKSILLPSVFSVEDDLDFVLQNVGALGDSLHLCLLVENFQQNVLEVWLMKEYGIVESWTKIVVFENILEPLNDWIPPAVIKVFGNGDLLFYRRPYVFLYKSKTNGLTKLDSDRIQSTMKPIDHRPSFASLNDLVRDNSSI